MWLFSNFSVYLFILLRQPDDRSFELPTVLPFDPHPLGRNCLNSCDHIVSSRPFLRFCWCSLEVFTDQGCMTISEARGECIHGDSFCLFYFLYFVLFNSHIATDCENIFSNNFFPMCTTINGLAL